MVSQQQVVHAPDTGTTTSSLGCSDKLPKKDSTATEVSCIDLICKLESLMTTVRGAKLAAQVENASETANQMLVLLLDYSDKHLDDKQAVNTQTEIVRASAASKVHQEVLRRRSWTSALRSLFVTCPVDVEARESYEKLGKALARACATAFENVLSMIDSRSDIGQQISQSTAVFLAELEHLWQIRLDSGCPSESPVKS